MKLLHLHINLALLALGFFSLTLASTTSYATDQIFAEYELEEVVDSLEEVASKKKFSDSDSNGNGNGNGFAILEKSDLSTCNFRDASSEYSLSTDIPKRAHLYILYCSLKLDC